MGIESCNLDVMRRTYHGFACKVVENRKSARKYGGAIGRGNSTSGRYHRVHLVITELT